jgi:hypothetical protein
MSLILQFALFRRVTLLFDPLTRVRESRYVLRRYDLRPAGRTVEYLVGQVAHLRMPALAGMVACDLR